MAMAAWGAVADVLAEEALVGFVAAARKKSTWTDADENADASDGRFVDYGRSHEASSALVAVKTLSALAQTCAVARDAVRARWLAHVRAARQRPDDAAWADAAVLAAGAFHVEAATAELLATDRQTGRAADSPALRSLAWSAGAAGNVATIARITEMALGNADEQVARLLYALHGASACGRLAALAWVLAQSRPLQPPKQLVSRAAALYGLARALQWLRVLPLFLPEELEGCLDRAARAEHWAAVSFLLEHGADPSGPHCEALSLAVKGASTSTAKVLLEHGVDVHAREEHALRLASSLRHAELVRLLLDTGADPFVTSHDFAVHAAGKTSTKEIPNGSTSRFDHSSQSALEFAVEFGCVDWVQRMVQHPACTTEKLQHQLRIALESNAASSVRDALVVALSAALGLATAVPYGTDLEDAGRTRARAVHANCGEPYQRTLARDLVVAAQARNSSHVRGLLWIGVDPRCEMAETALAAAADRFDVDTVQALLDGGTDPNAYGALKEVVSRSRHARENVAECVATAQALLAAGADVTAFDNAALRAAWPHSPEMLRVLVAAGADIRVLGPEPLRSAAGRGDLERASLLLDLGADVRADKDSALRQAVRSENAKNRAGLVRLLLERGADATAIDGNACAAGQLDEQVQRLLAEHGREGWRAAGTDRPKRRKILET